MNEMTITYRLDLQFAGPHVSTVTIAEEDLTTFYARIVGTLTGLTRGGAVILSAE